MLRKIFLTLGCFLLITISTISAFSLYIYLQPRDNSLLKFYLVHKLNKINPLLSIDMDKTNIALENRSLKIVIDKIGIYGFRGEIVGKIEQINLDFPIRNLLRFYFLPKNLTVISPTLELSHFMNQKTNLAEKTFLNKKNIFSTLLATRVNHHNFKVYNGLLTNKNNGKFKDFIINKFESKLSKLNGKLKISFLSDANIEQQQSQFYGYMDSPNFKEFTASINFSNLPESIIVNFMPNSVKNYLIIEELNFLLNGSFQISGNFLGKISEINGQIESSNGNLTKDIPLNKFSSHFIIKDNANIVTFNNTSLKFANNSEIKLNGILQTLDKGNIQLELALTNFNILNLAKLWPSQILPDAHTWIKGNIKGGIFNEITGKVNSTIQAFKENSLSPGEILLKGSFTNGQVSYGNDLPIGEHLEGDIIFDNKNISISANNGKLASSTIQDIHITIPYLDSKSDLVRVNGNVSGPVKDLLLYLPKNINLTDQPVEGKAVTVVKIDIPTNLEEIYFKDIKFDISSQISLNKFSLYNKYFLTTDNAQAYFNGQLFSLGATAHMFDMPVNFKLVSNLEHPDHLTHKLYYEADLTAEYLRKNLNTSFFKFDGGNIKLKGEASFLPSTIQFMCHMDSTNLAYQIPVLNFDDKISHKSFIEVNGDIKDNILDLHYIKLKNEKGEIEAKAQFDTKSSYMTALDISKFTSEKNNFELHYNIAEKVASLSVNAKTLLLNPEHLNVKSESEKYITTTKFNIAAQILELANKEKFNNFRLQGEKKDNLLTFLDIKAQGQGRSNISLAITPTTTSKKDVSASAENAGKLFKALNITQKMNEGTFTVNGKQNKNGSYKGKVTVKNFSLENNSILAKIVSLASLPGIANILKGDSGIPFHELIADYQIINGIIYLYNGQMNGNSLNLTFYGKVNTILKQVDFRGLVMPDIIGLNILGHIPLLGDVLSGGKKSILAANFSLKGPYKDATTFVNPLSIYPNILRTFFDTNNQCKALGLKDCN
jgi:hypothetical protein